jgi:hypothetical protein
VSAQVQYGSPSPPGQEVLGENQSGGPKNGGSKNGGSNNGGKPKGSSGGRNTAGSQREQGAAVAVQSARQIGASAGTGSLPFTGWAAMPVLVLGLGLLTTGLLLRRRVTRGDSA